METRDSLTIKNVAKRAGVSIATAARAIGGYGSVSESARERVMAAAEELHYVPNAIAQSMRRQSTQTLGIVVGDIQAPFFSKMIYCVEEIANKAGYNVLICNNNERPEKELMHMRSLFSKRVDGIIVSSALPQDAHIDDMSAQFYQGEIPLVQCDRWVKAIHCPLVQCDNFKGSYEATKYLLDLGHRNIGVLASNYGASSMQERLGGYRKALEEYGVAYREDRICYCEKSYIPEEGRKLTKHMLKEFPEMTALYVLNNPLYRSAWLELRESGIKIPGELSVLGWGDDQLTEAWDIAVVTQPIEEIAARAVGLLFDMIQRKEVAMDTRILLDTKLIRSKSCAPI